MSDGFTAAAAAAGVGAADAGLRGGCGGGVLRAVAEAIMLARGCLTVTSPESEAEKLFHDSLDLNVHTFIVIVVVVVVVVGATFC